MATSLPPFNQPWTKLNWPEALGKSVNDSTTIGHRCLSEPLLSLANQTINDAIKTPNVNVIDC